MNSRTRWGSNALLSVAAFLFVGTVVFVRSGSALLYGVDAGCYARIAKDLSERPIAQWYTMKLAGGEFLEHPPGALWLEALFFRVFGATAGTAVLYARVATLVLTTLVFLVARNTAGRRYAPWCCLALPLLSGFLYESQNPMLETPLSVGLTAACLGTVTLTRHRYAGTTLFVLGFVSAFWVKGPPALAAVLVLGWWCIRSRISWPVFAIVIGASLACLGATITAFEWCRITHGLDSFFYHYLRQQVLPSMAEGRNNPVWSPFYYVRYVLRWYAAGLAFLPLSIIVYKKMRNENDSAAMLIELGWLYVVVILVGFSIPIQKYQWYIHVTYPGFAWLIGTTLAVWSRRFAQHAQLWLPRAVLGLSIAYAGLVVFLPRLFETRRPELEAIHSLPAPTYPQGMTPTVAHCGKLGEWRAMHLFAFLWNAQLKRCNEDAVFEFDGRQIRDRSTVRKVTHLQ